jgi:hypothetical protein
MGGDDSQKLLPWRGAYSSPGRKPPARLQNQHSSSTAIRPFSIRVTHPSRLTTQGFQLSWCLPLWVLTQDSFCSITSFFTARFCRHFFG